MSDASVTNSSDITPTNPLKPGKIFRKATTATLIAGFIILFLTLGTSGESSTMGRIIGLSFTLVGLILFLSNTLQKVVKSSNKEAKSVIAIVTTLGPFLPAIGLLAWAIVIYSEHFDAIAKNKLTPSFSMLGTFLVLINLILTYMFYKNMNSKEFIETQQINKVSGMIIYFVEVLFLVIMISMFIIVRYFLTDGFKNYKEGMKNRYKKISKMKMKMKVNTGK
jgi:hypothetical protein